MSRPEPGPALILVIDGAREPDANFAGTLRADHVACLVLQPRSGSTMTSQTARRYVDAGHAQNILVLVANDPELARSAGADGVHLNWSKDIVQRYERARAALGENATVGAGAGRSRHDAMLLGERGADYVAFCIPDHVEDRDTAIQRRHNLVAWWTEIFEIPVVAFDVGTVDEAAALAGAGADFVALSATALADRPVEDFMLAVSAILAEERAAPA